MRRLYKRLAVTFLFSALLSVLILAISLYERGRKENGINLDQLLAGVENNLDRASDEYNEKLEHLREDCLSRARAVEYIVSNDGQQIGRTVLEVLKDLMEVGEISLIDSAGEIFLSTDEAMEGCKEADDVIEELNAAHGGDKEAIRMDQADFQNRPEYFYVVVGSDSEQFAAVRIDADLSREGLVSGKELVGEILRQATTEYETSIFAVGKQRGRVFGITENNSQEIRIRDVEEGAEMLDYLSVLSEEDQVLLHVNGAWQSAVVRDMEGMYLVAFTGMNRVVGNVLITFFLGLAAIGMISVMTVLMVHYHLKKYLFGHFEQVREGIYDVIRGKRDLWEDDSEIPELKPLMEMILQLEKEYVEKAQGIHRMEDQLSEARTEAEYDRLTGLYNRSGFERRTEEFLRGENPEGTLLLLDLDNFKRVNDCEGHPEGDMVLKRFAGCLSGVFRKGDVIGRIGGDEFAVLIRDPVPRRILEEKFAVLLGEVRRGLDKWYEKYKVSVSIGAVPTGGAVRDYRKLYRCADTALYISKYQGKDGFYINDKMIDCMRRECIRCRADCPRSRMLRD